MGDRYFPATALAGRLYVEYIGDHGPWDDKRLPFQDETVVDLLATPRAGHRKARTEAELLEGLRESERGLPTVRIWIHEGLQGTARRLWEESRT